ncbi:MAG: phosphate transporter periplasmic phosphate-binding protein, partial [Verrucomicrobia bacterium]|nr:phosphate transporter periplasmic phosphate-binding protein [Verrucomicrobiota bacterium]
DKWNPNYREYVESGSKMLADNAAGQTLGVNAMLAELSADKYGMGWTGIVQGKKFPGVKVLAVAANEGGPYVMPSAASVQSREYPLTRSVYMFLKRPTGTRLDPKVEEFLRYVLSREGQEQVAQNKKYLPLTADLVLEQRKKVE